MASTYPLEIVEAARWSKDHPDVKGDAVAGAVQSQTWDPSVKSLCAFPTVLAKMNEKIDWTQKLGDAFLAQQKEVMQAVQILRDKAKETGNLKSTKEVTVKEEPAPAGSPAPQTIIIESPDPEVVYVPTYNPTVVYGAWAYPYYPPYAYYPPGYAYGGAFWSFTAGVIVGGAIWGNCNWGGNDVDIDINRQNNFNRTRSTPTATTAATARAINSGNRAGNNAAGNKQSWQHNSEHRKGVGYKDSATQQKFGKGGNQQTVAAREQYRGHAEQGRQQMSREGAGNQRDMAGNSVGDSSAGTRDLGGSGSRDLGGASAGTRDMGGSNCSARRDMGGGSSDRAAQFSRDYGGSFFTIVRDPLPVPLAAPAAVAPARARPAVAAECRAAAAAAAAAMNQENYEMRATVLVLIASLAALTACAPSKPQNFDTPEAAVQALIEAAQAEGDRAVLKVLGKARANRSSTPAIAVADKNGARAISASLQRCEFARQERRGSSLSKWARTSGPSPFPIVTKAESGISTAAAGAEEIINRRVGENELDTIQSCLAYVDAQREYYMRNAQKDPLLHYAGRLISTEGKKDGLYWPAGEGEEQSPLGEGFAKARAEGYCDRKAR